MKNKIFAINFLKIIIFLIIAVIWIFPFWWMLVTALKTPGEVITWPPTLFPHQISFQSFVEVFKRVPMLKFFINSIITAFSVTTVAVFSSTLAGYIFAKFKFKGKNIIFLGVLGTIMIPLAVIIIPLYLMAIKAGLKNTLFALIIPGWVSALGIYLIRNYVSSIPDSYIEAARIDGASEFRIYTSIMLPLMKPAIAAIFIFIFMQNWDSFFWPLIVIDEISKQTLPLGIGLFTQGFGVQDWNVIMAGTLVSIIPMLLVFLFLQRFFIKGISLSGLKQ